MIARDLIVKLADVIFKAVNPANLLRVTVVAFLLTLADKLCKVLYEVPNLSHTESGDCGADHANDSGGEGS